MLKLPSDIVHDLKRGMHAVKRTTGTFNAVGCDLALEQSQNRSSAVTGGLIGITKNEEAMQRWLLLYPFKNSVHSMLTSYLGIQSDTTGDINSHNEWTQSRINTDENDVESIIKCFKGCSPFTTNGECVLRNIVTGELAEESTSRCLLHVKENGETLLTTYENERFFQKTKKLSDPIQKTKFYNFKDTPSKSIKNTSNKKLQDVTDITIFQKSFMTASQRGLNTRILASYEVLNGRVWPK